MRGKSIIGLKILIINTDGLQIRPNEEAQWLMSVRSDLDKSLTLGIPRSFGFVIRTMLNMSICNAQKYIIGLKILIINTDGLQIRTDESVSDLSKFVRTDIKCPGGALSS